MDLFRRIVLAALCAGTLSGFVITEAHQVVTVPIILEAEVFERAAEQPMDLASPADPAASVHHEEVVAWEPADGLERTVYTGLADVLTGIGFALLLVSAYSMTGTGGGWGKGLLWGLAGFAAFTLAPGLGLPPELPGTEAAPLLDRQIWWSATALLTAGGLALLMFRRQALWAIVAVVLIALPHVTGAPRLAEHASAVPESLAHRFVLAATVTSLLFWVCLGITTGYLFQRFSRHV
jgi:cobalt transporter subunit CbtA